jgi:hypothetical protein
MHLARDLSAYSQNQPARYVRDKRKDWRILKMIRNITIAFAFAALISIGFLSLACSNTAQGRTENPQAVESARPTAAVDANSTLYVCPMHPEETSYDADARCSICGMNLVEKDSVADESTIYRCPMHPDEHSYDPDDICSICGMRLVADNGGRQGK